MVTHSIIRGVTSNKRQNYTAYFSDPLFTDSLGVAIHDLSLDFGTFYSVNGDSIHYDLISINTKDDE